jgi:hypothetical protein
VLSVSTSDDTLIGLWSVSGRVGHRGQLKIHGCASEIQNGHEESRTVARL